MTTSPPAPAKVARLPGAAIAEIRRAAALTLSGSKTYKPSHSDVASGVIALCNHIAAIEAESAAMKAALAEVVAYARIACLSEGMPQGAEPKRLTAQVVDKETGESRFALLDMKKIRELLALAEPRT